MTQAKFTMHTPQGPTHCCVKHARMVENLFRFMGAHVNATKAPDDAECANCRNESTARRPQDDEAFSGEDQDAT